MDNIKFFNECNMEVMARYPDGYFDLAIVDPPYFTGPERRQYYGNENSPIGVKRVNYPVIDKWEIPGMDYYQELCRVSKHQIIWGINYFNFCAPPGRIIWDKVNSHSTFSDAEIASCSLHDSVRIFPYMWNGMNQGKSISEGRVMQGNKSLNEKRIHPTQKPVALYKYVLKQFATPDMKILDTHGGSFSIAIALHDFGIQEAVICEIDQEYFEKGVHRYHQHRRQLDLFRQPEAVTATQDVWGKDRRGAG